MQNLLRIISTISAVLCFPQNMNAQTIDYAVKVASGIAGISADQKIEIVDGFAAISADQIEIVDGFAAIFADKKICITNPRELDRDILRKLKLID